MEALLLVYGAASLAHFAHNAAFLSDYPGMPRWLSPAWICAAWIGMAALGLCGYLLLRKGLRLAGLCVIAAYAALGFDGLAHYALAPARDHDAAMHLTIGLEAAAAALLLAAVASALARPARMPRACR